MFQPPAPLDTHAIKSKDALSFFSKIAAVLHLPSLSGVYRGLAVELSTFLAEVHSSCYKTLADKVFGDFVDAELRDDSALKARFSQARAEIQWMPTGFGAHEQSFTTLARVLNHTKDNAAVYNDDSVLWYSLEKLMKLWMSDEVPHLQPVMAGLTCVNREYIVDLAQHYLALNKHEALLEQTKLLDLLTTRLLPDLNAVDDPNSGFSTPGSKHKQGTPQVTPSKEKEGLQRRESVLQRANSALKTYRSSFRGLEGSDVDFDPYLPDTIVSDVLLLAGGNLTVESAHELEKAVLSAVASLIYAVGPSNDSGLGEHVLTFLHKMAFRGSHAYAGISGALEALLTTHRGRLNDFLDKSFAKAHRTEVWCR
jgi:hypothetical protein